MVKHLSWPRFATLVLAAALGFHLIAAWLAHGFYRCDEQFQIIELASFKLGRTPAALLAWEYPAAIRAWFQPWLYYGVMRVLAGIGVVTPTAVARGLRLLGALFAWSGLWAWLRCLPHFIANDGWIRRTTAASLAFFYLVPEIAARTSGENFSQAFLAWAMLAFVRAQSCDYPRRAAFVWGFALAAGAAFLCRYQTAVVPLTMVAWLAWQKRDLRGRDVAIGGAATVVVLGLSAILDHWGYGFWSAPYIEYFRQNILLGKAASFGVSPWWRYIETVRWQVLPPFGYLLILGVVLGAIFARRDLLAWVVVIFVVSHSLIGHKELRFLFPVLQSALVLGGVAASRYAEPLRSWLWRRGRRLRQGLYVALGLAATTIVAMDILGLTTLSVRADLWYPVQAIEELTQLSPQGWLTYTWSKDLPLFSRCGLDMGFYRLPTTRTARYDATNHEPVAIDPVVPTFYIHFGEEADLLDAPAPPNCRFFKVSGPPALIPWTFRDSHRYALYRCGDPTSAPTPNTPPPPATTPNVAPSPAGMP